jgi:hypothetical protein
MVRLITNVKMVRGVVQTVEWQMGKAVYSTVSNLLPLVNSYTYLLLDSLCVFTYHIASHCDSSRVQGHIPSLLIGS